jgi:hypothetical protein
VPAGTRSRAASVSRASASCANSRARFSASNELVEKSIAHTIRLKITGGPSSAGCRVRRHHKDRARSPVQHLLRDRAEQHVIDARSPVRAHHDHCWRHQSPLPSGSRPWRQCPHGRRCQRCWCRSWTTRTCRQRHACRRSAFPR